MERMTQRIRGTGDALLSSHLEEKYTAEELIDILLARLASYEDTGLTPAQILVMKKRYDGRKFAVNTPPAKLVAWANTLDDDPHDYPGVFIGVDEGKGYAPDTICVVEYDPVAKGIFARLYADGDEPSHSVRFEEYDKGRKV